MVPAYIRIIPAYAGKSLPGYRRFNWSRDHPRLRGEKLHRGKKLFNSAGSSPLTRGKATAAAKKRYGCRIIPAYAGKSYKGAEAQVDPEDHPRLRGEKKHKGAGRNGRQGSSPLTRGKDRDFNYRVKVDGIIPAYAGKSRTSTRACVDV